MTEQTAIADWTCSRCEMTVSWMPEVERPELPGTWAKENGELYCLACRRDMAAEASLEGVAEDIPSNERQQISSRARIEFELKRRPDRQDNRIAKSCNTSIAAVRQARARLGLQSRTPD
ncbi:MAG: hypothetical protein ACRDL6_00645 [Solirubrobacterales bacterium]